MVRSNPQSETNGNISPFLNIFSCEKKDFLNNNNNKIMWADTPPPPPSLNPGSAPEYAIPTLSMHVHVHVAVNKYPCTRISVLVMIFIIWLTDFACCDWSIPGP